MLKKIMKMFKRKNKILVRSLRIEDWNWGDNDSLTVTGHTESWANIRKETEEIPIKLKVPASPSELLGLLEAPIKIDIKDIGKLIASIKQRIKFIKKDLGLDAQNEQRVLDMLYARKKYPTYAHLFNWKTTTQEKIQAMLDKYSDLRHRSISDYISHVPETAITEMQIYKKIFGKIADDEKVEFTIIAPIDYFRAEDLKNDPILLASSPFGNYFYVLCAWDKEINIVDQLLQENVEVKE